MTVQYPSIQRIAELQLFITSLAKIDRTQHLADIGRAENDVEHSFGLALTCWFLAARVAPELNLERILCYAIAHETVEVYSGDTFIYGDPSDIATKSDRENTAIKKLYSEWPDFTEMVDAAKRYKNKTDEEVKFVSAVDKLLPALMINLGEKSTFWNRHKITLEMEIENKHSIEVSDRVAPYYRKLIDWLKESNECYKENTD